MTNATIRISAAERRFIEAGGGWNYPGERRVSIETGGYTTMALVEKLERQRFVSMREEYVRDDGAPTGLRVSCVVWRPTAFGERVARSRAPGEAS